MITITIARKLPDPNKDGKTLISEAGSKRYGVPVGLWFHHPALSIPGREVYGDAGPVEVDPAPPPPPPPPPEPVPDMLLFASAKSLDNDGDGRVVSSGRNLIPGPEGVTWTALGLVDGEHLYGLDIAPETPA